MPTYDDGMLLLFYVDQAGDQNDDKAQISVPTFEDLHQNRYNQEMNRRVEEYSAVSHFYISTKVF